MPSKLLRRYDLLLLAMCAALVVLYVGTANGGFPLDDSWIHQVYGRNLAQTGQWAFVPGQPSAASTSPLYTVLLSIGYKLNISYRFWTHLLGGLALFVTALVGARMAERLMPEQRFAGLLAGVVIALAWHLVWAAASGMETMLFSMFTLVLMAVAWRELDERSPRLASVALRGLIFGGLAALATLTRPEGVMLAGFVGLAMLAVRPQGSLRGVIVWGLAAAIGFGVVIAPYLILNLQLTGGLLPDTAAAKQAQIAPFLAASYLSRLVDMAMPLVAGGQTLLLPGMVYFAVVELGQTRKELSKVFFLLPLLWAVALVMLYAARLPAPYQHGRYVIPALPSLLVAGVVGSVWLVRLGQRSLAGRVLTRALVASALLVFVFFAFVTGPGIYAKDVHIIDEEMVTAARWIDANIPPDDLLAIHDIGAVGYFTPRPILDIAGLVNPEVIPILLDKDALWQMLQERGARYLLAFPDQVPGGDVTDKHLCPVYTTNGPTAPAAGGHNMTLYALTWNGKCSG